MTARRNHLESRGQLSRRAFLTSSAAAAAVGLTTVRVTRGSEAVATAKPGRLVVDGLDASAVSAAFLELMRKGGVHCRHVTMTDHQSFFDVYGFVDEHSDDVVIARTVGDIRQAQVAGKLSFVLGAQAAGGYSSNNLGQVMWSAPLGNMDLLGRALRDQRGMGLRTQGICYNSANAFGSVCRNHAVPLTRTGRRLVEEVHKHKIVLDVGGPTGEQTSLDAIAMSSGVPVVCTHTNMAKLNNNARCISDRLAEAIAATGGLIGVTAISDFHVRNPQSANRDGKRSPRATLNAHLDQYDYLKKLVGVDHIALGPDFIWQRGDQYETHPEVHDLFPPDTISEGLLDTVDGFANIGELPNLIRGLQSRGWTAAEIDKVQ